MSPLRFLQRSAINVDQWDRCIAASEVKLPYGYSWYLDSVAENWGGYVLGNYQIVMPVVWVRKLGLRCVYQPYYCQQLGLFGKTIEKENYMTFLNTATKDFSYINMHLHTAPDEVVHRFSLTIRKNLLLKLNQPYPSLFSKFSASHRRNIQKAQKAGLYVREDFPLAAFQEFYLKQVDRKKESFKPKHEKIFIQLTKELHHRKSGSTYMCCNERGDLLSASFVVEADNRLINLISVTSNEGKKSGSSHTVFNHIVQKYSDSSMVLDFEGSSVAGVARFYEGFGSVNHPFYRYKTNSVTGLKQRFL